MSRTVVTVIGSSPSPVQNVRLEPVTAPGILSLVLNIVCAALNVIRGVHLVEYTLQVSVCRRVLVIPHEAVQSSFVNLTRYFLLVQDDYDGVWNILAFLLAFLCCVLQVNPPTTTSGKRSRPF